MLSYSRGAAELKGLQLRLKKALLSGASHASKIPEAGGETRVTLVMLSITNSSYFRACTGKGGDLKGIRSHVPGIIHEINNGTVSDKSSRLSPLRKERD